MTILKKSDILLGIDEPRQILIESLGGEIYLRPLSSAEVNKVVEIEAEGLGNFEASNLNRKTSATGKMNLKKMNEASAKAQYEAIYLSINNPKNEDEWTKEELQSLRKDAITELYEKIMEISGANTTEQDMKKFPEDE
jgi:hypothetical protein